MTLCAWLLYIQSLSLYFLWKSIGSLAPGTQKESLWLLGRLVLHLDSCYDGKTRDTERAGLSGQLLTHHSWDVILISLIMTLFSLGRG